MTAHKASPYQVPAQGEGPAAQLSQQELEKLQEIHELINLAINDLPLMAQQRTQHYELPALRAVPYSYSFFQFPWG